MGWQVSSNSLHILNVYLAVIAHVYISDGRWLASAETTIFEVIWLVHQIAYLHAISIKYKVKSSWIQKQNEQIQNNFETKSILLFLGKTISFDGWEIRCAFASCPFAACDHKTKIRIWDDT